MEIVIAAPLGLDPESHTVTQHDSTVKTAPVGNVLDVTENSMQMKKSISTLLKLATGTMLTVMISCGGEKIEVTFRADGSDATGSVQYRHSGKLSSVQGVSFPWETTVSADSDLDLSLKVIRGGFGSTEAFIYVEGELCDHASGTPWSDAFCSR